MTTREYRDMRDRARGIDRNEIYGSSRAYFPFPSATKTGNEKLLESLRSREQSIKNSNNIRSPNNENQ